MVEYFVPNEEEWNQGVVGLIDIHGNKVKRDDIVLLMGQEYGIYMIIKNSDDDFGYCLTDDKLLLDDTRILKFNEFLEYEDIHIIGKMDPNNKILFGKIGKTEKCMSFQKRKLLSKEVK